MKTADDVEAFFRSTKMQFNVVLVDANPPVDSEPMKLTLTLEQFASLFEIVFQHKLGLTNALPVLRAKRFR